MLIAHDTEKLLDTLGDFSLIVEGKRDKIALEILGLSDIFDISGKSIENFINTIPKDRGYVVLTDFDVEGEDKKGKIYKIFQKYKVRFNPNLRLKLRDFFKVVKIEELIKFSKLKEDIYNGKISSINYKILNRSKFHRKWCSRETRRNWGHIWSD